MTFEKVVVILVNYNTTKLLPKVLAALNEDKIELSILIVDNASSKESYHELLQIKDNRVHRVRLEENIGFAGGNNYGIQYAAKHYPDLKYVFLLNTDAYCSPNLIGNLLAIMSGKEEVACISPKILTRDGDKWYSGSYMNYKKGFVSASIKVPDDPLAYYEVDVFNGCAVLVKLDKLLEVGMLNEDLFMYYEEADCSIKFKKLGYKSLYAPGYTVIHDVSFTTRNINYVKTYYKTRNKFIVFSRFMSFPTQVKFLVHEFAHHLKNKRFKNARYLLKGYIDFKRGRTGKLQ